MKSLFPQDRMFKVFFPTRLEPTYKLSNKWEIMLQPSKMFQLRKHNRKNAREKTTMHPSSLSRNLFLTQARGCNAEAPPCDFDIKYSGGECN